MVPKNYRFIFVALILIVGVQDLMLKKYLIGIITLIIGLFLGLVYLAHSFPKKPAEKSISEKPE